MRVVNAGTTNVSVVIRIIDSSDGTPETGVVWNTAGIDLQYRREGAVSTAITEATLSALTDAHSDGGFLHIGNGYYRLDLPDAACAAGVTGVLVHGTVTGMVVIGEYIQLVAYDPFDAVRMGMTALPNAAADAAGGLPISDAGGLDLDAILTDTADIQANYATAAELAKVPKSDGTVSWNATALAAINAEADTAISDASLATAAELAKVPKSDGTASWNATALAAIESECNDALVAQKLDHLVAVADADDVVDNSIIAKLANSGATADWSLYVNTTDSLMAIRDRGDSDWITATGFSTHTAADVWTSGTRTLTANTNLNDPTAATIADAVWDELQADHVTVGSFGITATEIADILTDTAEIGTAGAGLTNINLPDQTMNITGDITGNLSGSVGSVTGAVGSVTAGVSVAAGGIASGSIASAELNNIADAMLDRNMSTGTDSGSTTVRTVRQALRAARNRVAISGGTATIYKEDDATSSWTAAVTTMAGNPISEVDPAGP